MGRIAVAAFAASVIGAAGCAQLAGIDDTTGDGLPGASVALQRMSIGNTVEIAPLDLTGLQASYLVAKPGSTTDFDRVAASNGGGGTWVTRLRAPAPVLLTLPGSPVQHSYAFPNLALSILFAAHEHVGRSPPPPGAMLTVTAQLDAATTESDSFEVFTVGSWTSHPVPVAMAGGTELSVSYAFDTSTSLTGSAELDRLTVRDAFLILRHAGNALTGVAEATPFDQTSNDMVSATMVPVTQDQAIDVVISSDIAKRYAAVRPAVSGLSMGWAVRAAPGARIAAPTGPQINSGTIMAADTGVSARYGNPFAGPPHRWSSIFTLGTNESRQVMLPLPGAPAMMLPATLYAGMSQFVDASSGVIGLIGIDAGLPELIKLGDKSLSIDGLTIPRPTQYVEITFTADVATNTLFGAQLFELLPDAAMPPTHFEPHLVFEATATEAKFLLPPDVLQPGHTYTLRAVCSAGGYPAIQSGSLTMRQLPFSQSVLDSGVFTVTP